MSRNRTEVSYRKLAIEGASPIGLLVALLDQLISDLRQAATALHNNDIETRCRELNHAALVAGQLESWVDRKSGGDNAELLLRFYSMIRAKMMEASIKKSAQVLEKLIEEIARVRTSWQKLDAVLVDHTHKPSDHASPQGYNSLQPAAGMASERIPFRKPADPRFESGRLAPRSPFRKRGTMKALVVDASSTMRSVLHRILSMRGFAVEEADDCQQAMDVLRSMGTADLVMVDWLPNQPGSLEFVARLRQEQAGDTRVMMLVAAEPGARELHGALIAGADDYLIKPFTSLQMDEKLAQVGLAWRP